MSDLPNKVMPTPSEWVVERLVRRIRDAGGRMLSDACRPTVIPPEGDATIEAYTTGCGGQTRAAIPFEASEGGTAVADEVVVCVVDDGVHAWPRFRPQTEGA